MKIATKLALAAALCAVSLGGYASAQTTNSVTPMMADDMVTIVNVGSKTDTANSDTSAIPATYRNPSPETISKAQAEIQNDPALMTALEAKNVQLENVIGIQTAATGGKIVYTK